MPALHCSSVGPVRFLQPETAFPLPDQTVHVWKFPVAPMVKKQLSEAEIAYAERFRSPEDKNRFSSGRQVLKLLCSKYLGIPAGEVVITGARHEKPAVRQDVNSSFHFNLSHSGAWILIAFADSELGIDIEEIKAGFTFRDIVEDQFSEAERKFVFHSPNPRRSFYELWTRKEALLKAWGSGLQTDLRTVPSLDGIHPLSSGHRSWKLESFPADNDYQAALAYPDLIQTLCYFDGTRLMD
jgi:4'-phosphopantetheinyl transferase